MKYQLEAIEWVQYWAEDCTKGGPRVLMIGDSISVGYRSEVFARVRDTYGCVTVSTSKALDNPRFCAEIDALAGFEFEYRAVHFNNGLHGFGLSEEVYREHYEKTVDFLAARWPEARLILAASTPVTDAGLNARVLERNRIAKEIADARGLEWDDLYAAVDGDLSLRANDPFHFNGKGYGILADKVAASLLGR